MPNRDEAWNLLCEYTQNESLRKHALAVEACVLSYARKGGHNEDLWAVAALLHDFDYERWPNQEHHATEGHPTEGAKILRQHGYPDDLIRAILSHADYTGVPRQSALEHALLPATSSPASSPPARWSAPARASSTSKSPP